MAKEDILNQIGVGAAAGLIGTAAMEAVRRVNHRLAPESESPVRQPPGEYVVDRVRDALPRGFKSALSGNIKTAASTLLSFGYGSTGAALYSSLRSEPKILRDGAALGVALWAVGYMGWLPAVRLAPKVSKQSPAQIVMSIGQHMLYGVATVAAYRKLKSKLPGELPTA